MKKIACGISLLPSAVWFHFSQRCFQSSNSRTYLAFHSSSMYPKHSRPQPSPPGLPPGRISVLPTSFHLTASHRLWPQLLQPPLRRFPQLLPVPLLQRILHPATMERGLQCNPDPFPPSASLSSGWPRPLPGFRMGPAICYQTRPGSPQPRTLCPTHCSRST